MQYDHSQTLINMSDCVLGSNPGQPLWTKAGETILIDTQLVSTIQNLISNGYLTIGSCRGSSRKNRSCGYINICGQRISPELMPQLKQPQKSYIEAIQLFEAAVKMIPSGEVRKNPDHSVVFLTWPWTECEKAIKAINSLL